MININCLLKNTDLLKNVHSLVEYMGYERMAKGKDASLESIYTDLKKAGVEVDIRTVGEIYKDALSHQDERFTQRSEVDKITGREKESTIRNLMLQKPKEGEQTIGRQSPEEFIANGLMKAFHNNIVEDLQTKSMMRELQDAAFKQSQRMVGELPNKKGPSTPEHFAETVKNALELDKKGYNTLEGTLNNAHTLFEGMKNEMAKGSAEIRGTSDEVLRGQWDDYIKSFEDATYSLLLSKEQAKNVLHGSLKEAGYSKELKDGRTILDWNKLASNVHDITKLRDTVRSVMEAQGYHPDTAIRIADALQKEYSEMRGTMIEKVKANHDKLQESWNAMSKSQKQQFDLNALVDKRLADWDVHKQLVGDTGQNVQFSKSEGAKIVVDALKSEGYGKAVKGGKVILDWTKMAGEIKDPSFIGDKVEAHLQNKGYSPEQAKQISEAVQQKYQEIRQDILDHAQNKLQSMLETAKNKTATPDKSALQRLAELHDLGIFDGSHEELLNHVVGIKDATRKDIANLAAIGKISADLTRELNGQNFLAAPIFQELQRQVNAIIGRNISNKTTMLKITGAIGHFFQLENMGIIGNVFNMVENNMSGAKEMFAANLDVLQKAGYENAFKDGRLLKSTWKNISAGGAEYGDEPSRFGHHDFISDRFNLKDINKTKLKDPTEYGKIMATMIIAPAKAYLNGSDGAFKATIHKKTMIMALHHGLVEQGMDKNEASHLLNQALYGKSLESSRKQASDMLDKYGQRNTPEMVERLANNLAIQNLNSDGRVSNDLVEAAYKSSYHTASLGMGHASNNPFSRMLLASKSKAINEENRLIKEENWGKLWHVRLMNTVWHNGIFRFMGGGANWGVLRLQSGFGIGIATGLWKKKFAAADELDFDSKEKLQASLQDHLNAQREIQRAVVGLSYLAVNAGIVAGYGALRKKDQDEDVNEGVFKSAYQGIGKSYVAKRLLNKVGADFILFDFLANTSKSANHGDLDAAFKYVQNNFNVGNSFSAGGEIMQAGQDVTRGEKGYQKALGDMGQVAGNMVEVPFYRSYKQVGKLFNYAITGADPKPKYLTAYGGWEGLFGGGLLEDAGVYRRNSPITALPGIGDKLAEQAALDGIRNINDLKSNPGWLQNNLSGQKLEKAQKAYDELYGGDEGTDKNNGGQSAGAGAGGTEYTQDNLQQ